MNTLARGARRPGGAVQPPVGCLASLFRIFGVRPAASRLPYRRRDYLLTVAERKFFSALVQAVGQRHLIFAKVRLGDLLYLPKGTEQRQSHFNRIQSKHIDFVLCDVHQVRPMLAIELDNSSHERADRVARDDFVNRACADAGLPLLRIRAQRAYSPAELRDSINTILNQSAPPPRSPR